MGSGRYFPFPAGQIAVPNVARTRVHRVLTNTEITQLSSWLVKNKCRYDIDDHEMCNSAYTCLYHFDQSEKKSKASLNALVRSRGENHSTSNTAQHDAKSCAVIDKKNVTLRHFVENRNHNGLDNPDGGFPTWNMQRASVVLNSTLLSPTWRRCGLNEEPRWARGSPFGRICICTDATAWTNGTTPVAPATATVALEAAGAAAVAAAEAAEFAARRPVDSEARCPVPIGSLGPHWCRSPQSRRARIQTIAARRPGRSPDPVA